jgi:hypothetical protein
MLLPKLNFPDYEFQLKAEGQKKMIFDIVRKKFIPLNPEEWVRQHAVMYLVQQLGCNTNTIGVEKGLKYHVLNKRFDIVVFKNGLIQPTCIVECKAPNVAIDNNTLLQAGVYNLKLNCRWMWLTNGITHYWLEIENGKIKPSVEPTAL